MTRFVLYPCDETSLRRLDELEAVSLGEPIEPVRYGEGFVFGRGDLITARTRTVEYASEKDSISADAKGGFF